MKKSLCAILGVLAIAAASPAQAAPASSVPVSAPAFAAIFHPDASSAQVETVQYRPHRGPYRYHRSYRHRPVYRHGYAHRGRPLVRRGPPRPGYYAAPAPFRRY